MSYTFGVLVAGNSPEAEAHNAKWLGPQTLAIEVTSPSLAARCGLGNNDPQHHENGTSSAIEEALSARNIPAPGSKLVTMREDKDSIGAMAIYLLRQMDRINFVSKPLISWIGAMDRHGFAKARELYPDLYELCNDSLVTDVLNVIARDTKQWTTLEKKVLLYARVLMGQLPRNEMRKIAESKQRATIDFGKVVEVYDQIAFIEAPREYLFAREWGSHRYEVTIVRDPEYHAQGKLLGMRMTVLAASERFDRGRFRKELNQEQARLLGISTEELRERETAWGGPPNIHSSPINTSVSKEFILKLASTCLKPNVPTEHSLTARSPNGYLEPNNRDHFPCLRRSHCARSTKWIC